MLVNAAIGFVLAMFLREWHLEDLRKKRELQAAELKALQEENEKISNAENDDEDDSEILEEETNKTQTNDNNFDDSKPKSEPVTESQPDNEIIVTENNNTNNIENFTDENFANENFTDENSINENFTENFTDPETDPNTETSDFASELLNVEPEISFENNPSDYVVDEIIDNMLSESESDIPTDHGIQNFNVQLENVTKSKYENESNPETEPVVDLESALLGADNESVASNTIDFSVLPDEYNYTAENQQNISQTAVDVLGENFDFNSLLAESKVTDFASAETKISQVADKPKPVENVEPIEGIELVEGIEPVESIEPVSDVLIGVFECGTINLQDAENFGYQSQETISHFTPNQSFTESTPPIYKRKNKKNKGTS
jgi:hypothetical protein